MEFVSEGCRQLTGYTPSEMQIGGSVQYNDLIHPDDRTMVWNEVQRGIERRESYRLTYRLITRNGEIKFVWEQGSAVVDEENRVVALEGFIADISEQKHAEEALQSREEHFRALIDNSSDVITLFDINGQFIYLSPSVERVLGYRADELKAPASSGACIATIADACERLCGALLSRAAMFLQNCAFATKTAVGAFSTR